MTAAALAAVDLGASSGRVIIGHVGPEHLEMTEVRRFRNGPIRLPDGLYWDVLGLYSDLLEGLRTAARMDRLTGLAIDSWAIDYGLCDPRGVLQANPRHYRDPRTEAVIDAVHTKLTPERLYSTTGLQFLPFNTLYQLAAEPDLVDRRALLIPDLLGYWLTGRQVAEETNASTTGQLDARTGDWSRPLVAALGLPPTLLPDVLAAGELLAPLSSQVMAEIGVDHELPLTTVGSHDTASAIVGVPADNPRFGYISCGTWGLVGVELAEPVLAEDSRRANFTNERGVDGTIRYLRNVMGLWLLSESMRAWNLNGLGVELGEILLAAAALPAGGPRIDPNDPAFLPPGDMPQRVAAAVGLANPAPEVIARCILDSLAAAFADALDDAERLSGQPIEVVHLVGGGSQNALLCQLIADAARRPVVAGPVEATALGNLLVQARTHRVVSGDLAALRKRVRAATRLHHYQPHR